ncbi:MAG: DUF1998 domain-containing protein [Chloroflexi bacterium]|nr:DUF1998 domain-containing protein [Chloroflexota bacterium]
MAPNPKVGEVRPSQLLYTYGVGSIIDLPKISVIVTGLEDWPATPDYMREIVEDRLLTAVQSRLHGVARLLAPPVDLDGSRPVNPFDDAAGIGVPVATFPRWMVCPYCRRLAPLSSGLFEPTYDRYLPDKTAYKHVNCTKPGKPPDVVPARFLVVCEDGHLDDFPWDYFVHAGDKCTGTPLYKLLDFGPSGEARSLLVSCETCGRSRRLSQAFGRDNLKNLPLCSGRRPHLRDYDDEPCGHTARAITLGASNMWFPSVLSALAIPEGDGQRERHLQDKWPLLKNVTGQETVLSFRSAGLLGPELSKYGDEEILDSILRRKQRLTNAQDGPPEQQDLLAPEWRVLSECDSSRNTQDFSLLPIDLGSSWHLPAIEQVVVVERLREAQALIGFTRLDAVDLTDTDPDINIRPVPLSRQNPEWVPTTEVRGEGIFIRFNESAIQAWEELESVTELARDFFNGHVKWRTLRNIGDPAGGFPGMRYVLLHSFSHILMRAMALESGYSLASLRERIYSRTPDEESGPMAGVLIYTAATDSEGTLGGLASMGAPSVLQRHILKALHDAGLCASDPLCAENMPGLDGRSIHAAACHNCLFAPETSCERGNKYLDRTVLVPTVEKGGVAFFDPDATG